MSRPASLAYKRYQQVLSRWPLDRVRPNSQLQETLRKNLESRQVVPGAAAPDESADVKSAEILETLLNDQYKKKYMLRGSIMSPRVKPTHFKDLIEELDRVHEKTWLSSFAERLLGKVRWK